MIDLAQLAGAWEHFFFEPAPVHSLAIFRIAFGLVLLLDAVFLLANLDQYLGPKGLTEHHRYFKHNHGRALSLFLHLPPTLGTVYGVMGLHLLAVTCLTLGFLTPLSAALAFLTVRSIVNRQPSISNGGDNVAKIMCFFLIFAPAGHAYSLDEILFHAPSHPGGEYQNQAPWAVRLMQIQVSIIYLYTAYWKLKGTTWRAGTAIYFAAVHAMYRKFETPRWLLRTPVVQMLTWGTLAVEFGLGFGLWIDDFRIWLVLLGFLLHLGAEYMLNVHLFGWYMMACLLLFVEPMEVLAWLPRDR